MKDFYDEINRFIESHEKAGYSFHEIKKTMKKAGYPSKIINKAFKEYKKKPVKKFTCKKYFNVFIENYKQIFLILAVFIVVVSVILFIPYSSSCNNKECFIESANLCDKASFSQEEGTITVEYSTEDCILTKKVIALDDSEPDEVKELFIDQEMKCRYAQDNFDPYMIDGFLNEVDQCEGALKDLIFQIRLIK